MNRLSRTLILVAAVFVVAGGIVHLVEWLDVYRYIPSSIAGAFVVTVGFPVNAALSLVVSAALVIAIAQPRIVVPVVAGALVFQLSSLAVLVGSRQGTVFGWTEPTWTTAATQSLVVEIGAVAALAAGVAVHLTAGRRRDGSAQVDLGATGRPSARPDHNGDAA